MSLGRVRTELEKHGLLLVTDSLLPSVGGIVAGEPIKGSWWSHPKAQAIYAVVEKLDDDEDVLLTTLVLNKQTFVHARFWRDLLSVAMARDRWQMDGLSKDDRTLLQRVESQGQIRASRTKTELPSRLLVHAKNIHTETGAHAKVTAVVVHVGEGDALSLPAQRSRSRQENARVHCRAMAREFRQESNVTVARPW